jgi:hypothetical protein
VTEAKVLFYVNHKYVCPFRQCEKRRFARFITSYSILSPESGIVNIINIKNI